MSKSCPCSISVLGVHISSVSTNFFAQLIFRQFNAASAVAQAAHKTIAIQMYPNPLHIKRSILCRPDTDSTALPAAAPVHAANADAHLSSLLLTGHNGTTFDLSSVFKPGVTQYGAMVGADCQEAKLCFETAEGKTVLFVPAGLSAFYILDSSDAYAWSNPMYSQWNHPSNTNHFSTSSFQSARLSVSFLIILADSQQCHTV